MPAIAPPLLNQDWVLWKMPQELADDIMRRSGIFGLNLLSRSCKLGDWMSVNFKQRMYTSARALGPPIERNELRNFQYMQGKSGLIVAGTRISKFFAFESGGNLLEAFCELDKCSLAADWFFDAGCAFKNATKQLPEFELDFLRVLEEVAGGGRMPFALTPRSDRAYDADKAAQVWVFERGPCTVELVATYKTPFDLVLDFNSTSAMNALTHLHAYCLYPSLTFKSEKALVLNMSRDMAPALRSEQDQNFFDELKGQGFKVVSSPLEWEACNPCCALTFLKPRFLSDRHTLQVDVSVIDKSSRVADYITVNSWSINYTGLTTRMDRLRFVCTDAFHTYVISPVEIKHLKRHFELIENASFDQAGSTDLTIRIVQNFARKLRVGLHPNKKAWDATKEILDLMSECDLVLLSVGTIQELFSFFVTLRKDFVARAELPPLIGNRMDGAAYVRVTYSVYRERDGGTSRERMEKWTECFEDWGLIIRLHWISLSEP